MFISIFRSVFLRLQSRSAFASSIAALAGGASVAHLISFLALPFLTRIYSPSDFSVLAVYTSLIAIFSVAACLRFEIAIPLPKSDRGAVSLLVIALFCSASISLILGASIFFFKIQILNLVNLNSIDQYLIIIPIGIWFASSFSAIQYWSTRLKRFNVVAGTRVIQTFFSAVLQILLGFLGAGPIGLIVGLIANSGVGLFSLINRSWSLDAKLIMAVRWRSIYGALRTYSRFPKYSTLDALANTAGSQLPILLIASIAVGPEAGYFILATKVISTPLMLIGSSVGQVYLSQAADELRAGTLSTFSHRIFNGLLKTGMGPAIFIAMIAPELFEVVFGKGWERAGEILVWMTPALALQFLSSPISMVMHVRMLQIHMLFLMIFGLFIRVGALFLAKVYFLNSVIEVYSIAATFYYLILFIVFYKVSGCLFKSLLKPTKETLKVLISWIFFGALIKGILVWA